MSHVKCNKSCCNTSQMNLIGYLMIHLPTKISNVNAVLIKLLLRVIVYKVLDPILNIDRVGLDSSEISLISPQLYASYHNFTYIMHIKN